MSNGTIEYNLLWMRTKSRFGLLPFLGFLAIAILFAGLAWGIVNSMAPQDACDRPEAATPAGLSAHRLWVGDQERCYLLYVPAAYDPAQPAPLLVNLHAFSAGPKEQMQLSGSNELAETANIVVVYPQGSSFPQRWHTVAPADDPRVDDVQFIRATIADVSRLLAVNPVRVYVMGFSNGGSLAQRLACEAADLVAAVGSVGSPAPNLPGGCQPARPVPLIAFHGTADPISPYEGGVISFPVLDGLISTNPTPLTVPPVESWLAAWAERNGCQETGELQGVTAGVIAKRYSGCREGAEVRLYIVDGGGHIWPGGGELPAGVFGPASQAINASQVIWDFFEIHPKP